MEPEVLSPVLVVDNIEEVRGIIVWMLQVSGYRAIATEDKSARQRLLLTQQPTLIIAQFSMPLHDGWDVLMFCHPKHLEIPVIIVSGASLDQLSDIAAWAAAFVFKPFDSRQFRTAVGHRLNRSGSWRSHDRRHPPRPSLGRRTLGV